MGHFATAQKNLPRTNRKAERERKQHILMTLHELQIQPCLQVTIFGLFNSVSY